MAGNTARVVRTVVAVVAAVGLASLVYPAAPYAMVLGVGIATTGFAGSAAEPLAGTALAFGGLGLTVAPVLLVLVALWPPWTAIGWTACVAFLVAAAACFSYGLTGRFVEGSLNLARR